MCGIYVDFYSEPAQVNIKGLRAAPPIIRLPTRAPGFFCIIDHFASSHIPNPSCRFSRCFCRCYYTKLLNAGITLTLSLVSVILKTALRYNKLNLKRYFCFCRSLYRLFCSSDNKCRFACPHNSSERHRRLFPLP